MQPIQDNQSFSTNRQAKAAFKNSSALVHQPGQPGILQEPEFVRQAPPPINIPQIPQIKISLIDAESLLGTVAILSTLAVPIVWGITPINNLARGFFKVTETAARYTQETFGNLGFTPKPGDKINGYTVTSGYGDRPAPCAGCSTFHPAIDIGTPIGTPVYIPARPQNDFAKDKGETVLIQCRQPNQTGGGGLVAEILLPERGIIYQALHLSKCSDKLMGGGHQFGESGNSGVGTGAHLDLRKATTTAKNFSELSRPLNHEPITTYEAWWFLTGVAPKPDAPKEAK
jgi:hypothetical protein